MASILIVFSSIGGNTELVVDRVREELQKHNLGAQKKRVDVTKAREVLDYDLTILASPTYGQGTVEDHFKPFLKDLETLDLSGKNLAVVGLGDTKYYPEYLTESAIILEEYVKKQHGNLIVPALRIGMPPLKYIEKLVPGWIEKVYTSIAPKQ